MRPTGSHSRPLCARVRHGYIPLSNKKLPSEKKATDAS